MLTLEPSASEQDYERLLQLVFLHRLPYLEPKLDLIQLTCEGFGEYFRRTGTALKICQDGRPLGLCWIEQRGRVLFLIGLLVEPEAQGQGIGTWALEQLQTQFRGQVDCLELQVHASNPRAKELYERCGYQTVAFQPESGFYTLQKAL